MTTILDEIKERLRKAELLNEGERRDVTIEAVVEFAVAALKDLKYLIERLEYCEANARRNRNVPKIVSGMRKRSQH